MAVSFLTSVAQAYLSKYKNFCDFLFVFPGRRAGAFFLKRLSEAAPGRDILLPRVMTMADFAELLSGRIMVGRIEQLFLLYQAYQQLLTSQNVKNIPDFDSFRRWGETALSDFNEVDMQDVDPQALFKNVKDLREISSNFLTEEQMKVMNEFFGQAYDPEQVATSFWKKFTDAEESELHSKFRLLWQVLSPLYRHFKEKLEAKGLISAGGAYRMAADRLEEGLPAELRVSKIVLVGFNALTSSERRIFDALASLENEYGDPLADFFWDATGPVIADASSSAGRYVNFNRKRWPSPDWALPFVEKSDVAEITQQIKVISVPSDSMQTKIVAEILSDMKNRLPDKDFTDTKVAVVLPDEQLLIPLLYSLPEEISEVNLTMGYPLRISGVATFISLLRRLEMTRRKSGTEVGYYYKDLNTLLSHPFSRLLFGSGATEVKDWIRLHHKYIVNIADVRNLCPKMVKLLAPVDDSATPRETAVWLDRILSEIMESILSEKANKSNKKTANVDVTNVNAYRTALRRMLSAVEEYGIGMQWRTFLSMTERLLAGETVTFDGQPLRGLQVMGILETRTIDFERIIIPSLNERILPARRRARTFISDSLRKAYGMPPVNYSESLFSYYFYRMISRAKEVVLMYDSRSSEGVKSGDVSRYVLQLQYLYARDNIKMESRTFLMSKSQLKPSEVAKTDEICEILTSFLDSESRNNLSATALTKYASCQLRFYFENVLKIKTDEESHEFIDVMTQGSVVHDVMQNIYLPDGMQKIYLKHPQIIDAALIESRIKDTHNIDRLIRQSINTRFYHLPKEEIDRPLRGSSAHVAKILRKQVISILNFDLSQAPFSLYGVEMDGNLSLQLRDGRLVNMRYAIDRLDKTCISDGGIERETLRIVDYKTGKAHAEATTMEAVFNGEYQGKNLLQLWLYANLFDALPDKNFDKNGQRPLIRLFGDENDCSEAPLLLELYELGELQGGKHTYPKVGKQFQMNHREQNAEFLANLEKMLTEIFDPEQPFRPAQDEKACKMCPFKTICWR